MRLSRGFKFDENGKAIMEKIAKLPIGELLHGKWSSHVHLHEYCSIPLRIVNKLIDVIGQHVSLRTKRDVEILIAAIEPIIITETQNRVCSADAMLYAIVETGVKRAFTSRGIEPSELKPIMDTKVNLIIMDEMNRVTNMVMERLHNLLFP